MRKSLLSFATLVVLGLPAAGAAATTVFDDNFESYGDTTIYRANTGNFAGKWTVSGGSVDYISHLDNTDQIADDFCGTGRNCIDLDGTEDLNVPGTSALFETSMIFLPGRYDLNFQIAGNNRNAGVEVVTIRFGDLTIPLTLGASQVTWHGDFGTVFKSIRVGPGGSTLSFQNSGRDNVGALLKYTAVDRITASVPLPAAGFALALGLAGLLALRGRRKAV